MTQYTIVMQSGRPYRVPSEYAKKFIKKNELVTQAMSLKSMLKDSTLNIVDREQLSQQLNKIMGKIVQLNRKIPPCAIPIG